MLRHALVMLAAAAVGACGGGERDLESPAGAFVLAATSTEFTAQQNHAPPPSRSIGLAITGSDVTKVSATHPNGQAPPGWLGIEILGGRSSYKLVVSILSTSLPVGRYTSTFQVGTTDSRGNVLQQKSFTVTYTVSAGLAMSVTPRRADFIFGDTRTTETVTLEVLSAGRQWSLGSSAPWLQVPAGTQTGNATVTATIDVNGLNPGTYTATIRAASGSDTASSDVTVVVAPATFTVAEDAVLLGGTDGRSNTLQQTVHFALAAGNGVHPYTITLTTDDGGSWLSADLLNGNVGSSGASVTLIALRNGLTGGTRTGQLRISVDVNGTTLTEVRPVTFNSEPIRGGNQAFRDRS